MRPDSFAELLSAYNGPESALADFVLALQRQRLKLVEDVMEMRGAPWQDSPKAIMRILIDWLRLRLLNARLIEHLVDHSDKSLADRRGFYKSLAKQFRVTVQITRN